MGGVEVGLRAQQVSLVLLRHLDRAGVDGDIDVRALGLGQVEQEVALEAREPALDGEQAERAYREPHRPVALVDAVERGRPATEAAASQAAVPSQRGNRCIGFVRLLRRPPGAMSSVTAAGTRRGRCPVSRGPLAPMAEAPSSCWPTRSTGPRGHPLAVRTGRGAPGPPAELKLRHPGGEALLRASPVSWQERSRRMVGTAGEATAATPHPGLQRRAGPPGAAPGGAPFSRQRSPRQPRLSRNPSSGTQKRGTPTGKDGNHEGRSAEGGRRTRRGIRSSGSGPDALVSIG